MWVDQQNQSILPIKVISYEVKRRKMFFFYLPLQLHPGGLLIKYLVDQPMIFDSRIWTIPPVMNPSAKDAFSTDIEMCARLNAFRASRDQTTHSVIPQPSDIQMCPVYIDFGLCRWPLWSP